MSDSLFYPSNSQLWTIASFLLPVRSVTIPIPNKFTAPLPDSYYQSVECRFHQYKTLSIVLTITSFLEPASRLTISLHSSEQIASLWYQSAEWPLYQYTTVWYLLPVWELVTCLKSEVIYLMLVKSVTTPNPKLLTTIWSLLPVSSMIEFHKHYQLAQLLFHQFINCSAMLWRQMPMNRFRGD